MKTRKYRDKKAEMKIISTLLICVFFLFGCKTISDHTVSEVYHANLRLTQEALKQIDKYYVVHVDPVVLFEETVKSFKRKDSNDLQIIKQSSGVFNVSCNQEKREIKVSDIYWGNLAISFDRLSPVLEECINDKSIINSKEYEYLLLNYILSSLDSHSSFMRPESFQEMKEYTGRYLGGPGIQIGIKERLLTVIAPIEDTAAHKAGIKAGDIIVRIDGKSTEDISLNEAVTRLRGQKGSSVTLTIVRDELAKPRDFTIVRDKFNLKTVKSQIINNKIGYIKLTHFQQETASDLKNALNNLSHKGIKSLILDLRNNPGGLLKGAIDVASQFLPPGKLVVYIKGEKSDKTELHSINSKQSFVYPMVVLVDEGTASASEIVAGALQDWGKALVIGTDTYGKGGVQTVVPLSDGSALRLTSYYYYTPNGTSIQHSKITPDLIVTNNKSLVIDENNDSQLIAAKDLINEILNKSDIKKAIEYIIAKRKPLPSEKDGLGKSSAVSKAQEFFSNSQELGHSVRPEVPVQKSIKSSVKSKDIIKEQKVNSGEDFVIADIVPSMSRYQNKAITAKGDNVELREELKKTHNSSELQELLNKYPSEKRRIIPKLEKAIVEEIEQSGIHSRFMIKEIMPVEGPSGSFTIKGTGPDKSTIMKEFKGDDIPMRNFGGIPFPLLNGENSIIRINGKVRQMDVTFISQNNDLNRLTFYLKKGVGWVYIRGEGKVVLKNGDAVYLPKEGGIK